MTVSENKVRRNTFTPTGTEDHYHYSSQNIVRVTTSRGGGEGNCVQVFVLAPEGESTLKTYA